MTPRVRDGDSESTDPIVSGDSIPPRPARTREGWYFDPLRRHEYRWFSAGMPTALVRDGYVDGKDPVDLSELGRAAFASVNEGPGLPDPPEPRPETKGPAAWWDGAVAAPGEPGFEFGLDGAVGFELEAGARVAMRAAARKLLSLDLRLAVSGVAFILVGLAGLVMTSFLAWATLVALGIMIFAAGAVASLFDFLKELPARRLEKRSRQ